MIHFVGIGGIGMSSIANFLIKKKYKISGSDLNPNLFTKKLSNMGALISFKHSYKNVLKANIVVISSAIPKNNIEIITAIKLNIPILKRAQMLSIISKKKYTIAITGSHGKTTTTGIIFNIYNEAKLYPNLINGGIVKDIKSFSKTGKGLYFIVEVDESDGSLVYIQPNVAILTNIEHEHLRNYQNNFNNLQQTYIKFLNNTPNNKISIICIDNLGINQIIKKITSKVITYGFSQKSDFRIVNYYQINFKCYFTLVRNKKNILNITLNLPGKHNALNATASVITALIQKIHPTIILKALKKFKGIEKRFELLGHFNLTLKNNKHSKLMIISDYGHHPNEILYNIQTIRNGWKDKKITMIFQPHKFSRTQDLFKQFISVLSLVDNLLMLNVFSAEECVIPGYNSIDLCKKIITVSNLKPTLITNYNNILSILKKKLFQKNIVLIQGAGNVHDIIYKHFVSKLSPIRQMFNKK
ncbi:UDP-N-acetylmuramate--L-alanine ligase [Buchnera aphidicola]|nr:UDP-N-acetylmuramate--L-alanine ligase [Buchnera aphidicola]